MSEQLAVCRICETDTDLEDIFQSNLDVAQKLMICTDVKVDINDDLPKYICSRCRCNLNFVYEFKTQCEHTDKKLREFLAIEQGKVLQQNETERTEENIVLNETDEGNGHLFIAESDEEVAEYLLDDYTDVEELIEEGETEEESVNLCGTLESEVISPIISNNEEIIPITRIIKTKERINAINEADTIIHELEEVTGTVKSQRKTCLEEITVSNYYEQGAGTDANSRLEEDPSENVSTVLSIFLNIPTRNNDHSEDKKEEVIEEVVNEWKDIGESNTRTILSKKIFICDTCGEKFRLLRDFSLHIKSHGNQRYQCPVCKKWFSMRYLLKNHMTIHEESKNFICEICGNKYTNRGNRDRHIRHFHKQEKPYMCTKCGLSFSRSTILKLHYTVHMKERNYECGICNKRFKAEYYLNLHKKSHIPIEERHPPQVQANKKKTTTTNQKEPLIICPYCGKKSGTKALHLSHIRVHTGEKPFECKTCGKKFAFRQSLKSHKFLHTGEKPYRCEICGLTFRQIGHLKGHMLIHSGIKKHKCQYCDKAFRLKSNLVVHQRLHTGDKPYHCSYCTKSFYDSNGLKRHEHSHHKVKKNRVNVGVEQELRSIIT